MPIPALLSTIAGQVAGTAIQGTAQGLLNQGQNSQNIKNYRIQHQDAIIDRNNERAYNDPSEVINRLSNAGINPHTIGGNSLVTSSPQTRGSSIAAAPQAYQVNGATNQLQMQQGLEQIKLMRLQQAKVEADTRSVEADIKNKDLGYGSEVQAYGEDGMSVIKKRKLYELEQLLNTLNKTSNESQLIAQNTANAAAANKGIRANSDIAEIEKLFRSDQLQGKNTLMQEQVRQYILRNYKDEIENRYANKNAANRASITESDAEIRKLEAQVADAMPAPVRYFLERMGGSQLAPMLLNALLKKKVGSAVLPKSTNLLVPQLNKAKLKQLQNWRND
jgi:hypothetical protein